MRSKNTLACRFNDPEVDELALEGLTAAGDLRVDVPPDAQPTEVIDYELTPEAERAQLRIAREAPVHISDMVEKIITIDALPFRFIAPAPGRPDMTHDRSYLKPLYDLAAEYPQGSRNILLHCGRQVEKSTSQAGKAITLGATIPALKTLYVAPRYDQVTIFSSQRFKPMAEDSSYLKERGLLKPSKTLWQVGAKEFVNRSFFNFRSCYLTADGCRGITAQNLLIDELQDIITDNIPVLEECQAHWGWETGLRFRLYAGTPKTTKNPLSRRYSRSSRFEWMVPCSGCRHDNFVDDKIVGLHHYICTKCGKEIHMRDGRWIPQNPAALDVCWGFRISQLMVPYKTHAEILSKVQDPNISQLKLFNETFGLPFDEGEVVLTEALLRSRCEPNRSNQTPQQVKASSTHEFPIFAGIDHGSGEGDTPSYTVLALGTIDVAGIIRVLHIKKFTGRLMALEPQPRLLHEMMTNAGVLLAFSDWGFGAHQNARLCSNEFGWRRTRGLRMLGEVQYVSQRALMTYDAVGARYHVDRNQSMIACIDDIKQGRIRFFREEEMAEFFPDFLTIYTEFNETYGTTKFDHTEPDDVFHAVNLMRLAALTYRGILIPSFAQQIGKIDPGSLGY